MLHLRNYADEIDEIEPGQTIRINHTECDAGEDTRQRLYLTRTHADDTVVIGYCHNCQQGGRYKDKAYAAYRDRKHTAVKRTPEIKDNIIEPPGLVRQLSDWPIDAQAWAISRRLDQVLLDKYSIAYDPTSDRVYLPKLEGTELMGYQLRAIHEGQQPKYYTVSDPDAKSWTTFLGDEVCLDITIVEDLISGIHIAEAGKTGAVVLHGVKIDPVLMYLIARNWKSAVIWLDNDSQHVDNQAKQMERTIKMYSPHIEVGRVSEYRDPKYYKSREIVSIIEEALDGQH